AVLYALSLLCGVLTRSPIVSILVAIGFWFLLWAVGFAADYVETMQRAEVRLAEAAKQAEPGEEPEQLPGFLRPPPGVDQPLRAVEYVLPRFRDLDRLMRRFLAEQLLTSEELRQRSQEEKAEISWGESLTVSGVFIALMLGLACWRFAVTDY